MAAAGSDGNGPVDKVKAAVKANDPAGLQAALGTLKAMLGKTFQELYTPPKGVSPFSMVSTTGKGKQTLLQYALENKCLKVVATLARAGVDISTGDPSPLYEATWAQDEDAVQALLAAGADVNYLPPKPTGRHAGRMVRAARRTALHTAVVKETADMDVITRLLKAGADVNIADNENGDDNAFTEAVGKRDMKLVSLFLNQGAHFKQYPGFDEPLLHIFACRAGLDDIAIFSAICARAGKGALNLQTESKDTALHYAFMGRDKDTCMYVADALVVAGADPNLKNSSGKTPQQAADEAGVKWTPEDHKTRALPLPWLRKQVAYACWNDELDMIREVMGKLKRGHNLGPADIVTLERYQERGADVVDDRPALICAAAHGSYRVCAWLLRHGADPAVRGTHGNAARTLVVSKVRPKRRSALLRIVKVLKDGGVDLDKPDGGANSTPVDLACTFEDTSMLQALLEAGASPSRTHGRTKKNSSLISCIVSGYLDGVALLLQHGASPVSEGGGKDVYDTAAMFADEKNVVQSTIIPSLVLSSGFGGDGVVDQEVRDSSMLTAAAKLSAPAVAVMLKAGAQATAATHDGNALRFVLDAIGEGEASPDFAGRALATVKVLLDAGCKPADKIDKHELKQAVKMLQEIRGSS